jgi:3-phosphoshikimate 1-carboxyvinyltransferase
MQFSLPFKYLLMNISLELQRLSGVISVPPSKSISQRVCAAALLHKGETIVHNLGFSNDEIIALEIIQDLGAKTFWAGKDLHIVSNGLVGSTSSINCGESGLASRMFAPIVALSRSPIKVLGDGSLLQRPMGFMIEAFANLKVQFSSNQGYLPFTICGPLTEKDILVDGRLSSQFLSGLLFAFSSVARKKVIVEVEGLVSKPYVALTLEVLKTFGKEIIHQDYRIFELNPERFIFPELVEIDIENDWSSAAFWIVAATIQGSIKLQGLNPNSCQADKIILEVVAEVGAKIEWESKQLLIQSNQLHSFSINLNDSPDLFPVLSILAACCQGESRLIGMHRLIHKESNRAAAIESLLTQLGVRFRIDQDALIIEGQKSFAALTYVCPNDHRMAMAAALTSIRSNEPIIIQNASCVHKSYPTFWDDVQKAFGNSV